MRVHTRPPGEPCHNQNVARGADRGRAGSLLGRRGRVESDLTAYFTARLPEALHPCPRQTHYTQTPGRERARRAADTPGSTQPRRSPSPRRPGAGLRAVLHPGQVIKSLPGSVSTSPLYTHAKNHLGKAGALGRRGRRLGTPTRHTAEPSDGAASRNGAQGAGGVTECHGTCRVNYTVRDVTAAQKKSVLSS